MTISTFERRKAQREKMLRAPTEQNITPTKRSQRAIWRIRKLVSEYPANGHTEEDVWTIATDIIYVELRRQRKADVKRLLTRYTDATMQEAFERWALEDLARER